MDSSDKKETVAQNQEVPELTKGMQGLSLEEQKTLDRDQNDKKSPLTNSENPPDAILKSSSEKDTVAQEQNENNFVKTAKNSPNLFFYQNKITSKPKGTYLEDMHRKWYYKYKYIIDEF